MAGECPGWYCLFLAAQKSADAYGELNGDGVASTNSVTVTGIGGVAPYSFAWTRISGSLFTRVGGTSATAYWEYNHTAPSNETETWRCTVTDAALNTATVDVTVQIVHNLP